MSKVTKKQLQQSIDLLNKENSSQHTYLMRIKRALKSIDIDILSNEFDESKPQLKQLDQSIFDGLDEKWRFAAVDANGVVHVYDETPRLLENLFHAHKGMEQEWFGTGYDTSNWQNSLIERDIAKELLEVDLSSELTGSELVRAMLERGDRCVMCMVANNEVNMFLATRPVVVHGCTDSGFISVSGCYSFAVAVNNQGEPLTAAEAGF